MMATEQVAAATIATAIAITKAIAAAPVPATSTSFVPVSVKQKTLLERGVRVKENINCVCLFCHFAELGTGVCCFTTRF